MNQPETEGEMIEPGTRNAVRAVIVRDGAVLLQRKVDDSGERFALPGGAQETGETLAEALQRECLEEIGTRVEILDLLHIADYFKPRSDSPTTVRHVLEMLFACRVPANYQPVNGSRPDKHQVEVLWMPLRSLTRVSLLPLDIAALLQQPTSDRKVYLGRIC